jgi:cyanophycinase
MRLSILALALGLIFTFPLVAMADEPVLASALAEPVASVPGSLVLVGGGATPEVILDRFLQLAGGKHAHLVVIPTASIKADRPDQLKSFGYWRAQDVASVVLLHTRKREQANDREFTKALQDATGVWISGGDQSKLVEAYRGTVVERELHHLMARGGVVGGTSAGAAVMSSVMITGGNTAPQVDAGFGLLPGVVVDQHLMRRNRVPRLLSALTTHPGYFGLGIDEQTAVVVKGHTLTVLGDATVRVCFCACGGQGAAVETLHTGEERDLALLSSKAVSRARAVLAKDKTEVAHPAKAATPAAPAHGESTHAMK